MDPIIEVAPDKMESAKDLESIAYKLQKDSGENAFFVVSNNVQKPMVKRIQLAPGQIYVQDYMDGEPVEDSLIVI